VVEFSVVIDDARVLVSPASKVIYWFNAVQISTIVFSVHFNYSHKTTFLAGIINSFQRLQTSSFNHCAVSLGFRETGNVECLNNNGAVSRTNV
jgi:hypothetical protein